MALNSTEIERVLAEISPVLCGGWVQKIQQPTDHTLIFDIRVPGHTHRLLICCNPETSRLHLTNHHQLNPPTPPAFCQFLRAHIQGARIDQISQVPNDRIVEMAFTSKEGPHTLVCELTGKNANILVLDPNRLVLRELLHQRGHAGKMYVHPTQRLTDLHRTPPVRFASENGHSLSAAIDATYSHRESTLSFARAKEARMRTLKTALKKERRRIEAWQDDLDRAAKYRDYARYGELIKSNLSAIGKGAEYITVTDYFDESLPEITIPLDPTKSPQGNMDDYFRKHRKHIAAERELSPRIEQAKRDMETRQEELRAIECGTWTPSPPSPSQQHTAERMTLQGSPKLREARRGPFRRFLSADGLAIFVGRNAKENDELTFGLAKSDDLWLHARGTPGSHVVVRLGKGIDPPPETIRDAATLALLYSDLKKSGKGEVIYTRRKWVKKAKGQAPGAVLVTQEKSIHVSLDKTRLDALKVRSSGESS